MTTSTIRPSFIDLRAAPVDLNEEILAGLLAPHKSLPSKLLYDAVGSALFEQIVECPEYYLARAELSILANSGTSIAERIGPRATIIEYGIGSGTKTRSLLSALRDPHSYIAIDFDPLTLVKSTKELATAFPGLEILAVCADWNQPLDLRSIASGADERRRVGFFPGSTIGNLTMPEARRFLESVAAVVGEGGGLLVGIDLKKSSAILELAYNDSQGITAAFNKNILSHVNTLVGADFDIDRFEHIAIFDDLRSCVEMHLISLAAQTVHVDRHAIEFRVGESIHTETCMKWDAGRFEAFAAESGFAVEGRWTDEQELFAVMLLVH